MNASKGEIHVLDSFGENMSNWQDLDYMVWLNDIYIYIHIIFKKIVNIPFLNLGVWVIAVNKNG